MKAIAHLMKGGQLCDDLIAVQIALDEFAGYARTYWTGMFADIKTNFLEDLRDGDTH